MELPHTGENLHVMYPRNTSNPNCISCPWSWSKKRNENDINWFCTLPCCDPCNGKTLRSREMEAASQDSELGISFAKRWSCRACVKPPSWYCRLPCCGNSCLPGVTCKTCGNYRKRDLEERTETAPSDCPPMPPCDCGCNPLTKRQVAFEEVLPAELKPRHESLSCIFCPQSWYVSFDAN
jgi:hypothetical protein